MKVEGCGLGAEGGDEVFGGEAGGVGLGEDVTDGGEEKLRVT